MATNAYIFFFYILFLSLHASQPYVNGARVVEKNAPSFTCPVSTRGLPIFHRYGSCSPSSRKKQPANSGQMLLQDEIRVQFINAGETKNPTGIDELSAAQPVGAGIYTVSVGFGTPVKNFNLILDTGSSITWVRCPGSRSSKQQKCSKLYNPSCSKTSSNASCPTIKKCEYTQEYFDRSFAEGVFVLDTLTIQSYVFPNFFFLCAKKLSPRGFTEDDHGLLALGPSRSKDELGNYSFISQTASSIANAFCHCLPTTSTIGNLYFGKEALENCKNSGTYTPLDPRNNYYYVSLTAVTIGKTRLKIPSASSPGTIVDSGTVITRLPSSVYKALRSEFKSLMSEYPSAPGDKFLKTCYNLQGYDDSVIPKMVLHFENLDVNLDQTAVTWKGNENFSQVCLAFAEAEKNNGLTIIGSHQLQKLNVLYNIQGRRLEIGPGNC